MPGTTPPPLHGPSSKEKKYDRQLRLWAASGQAALEDARVLLVNSGPGVVGIETLKNLVLPGIGHFAILDSAAISEADLGANFFLEEDSLGESRAEHCSRLLRELNPDVDGTCITEPIEAFTSDPNALRPYTLILATQSLGPDVLSLLSKYASQTSTPLFYIHSVGFYSHFSLHLPEAFPIVDTHPDPASTTDLRLLTPWPELVDIMKNKTAGLEGMSDDDHGHVPYLLLLLRYLADWRATHEGKAPSTYKEKAEFRDLVASGARTGGAEGTEENFEEARGAVLKSLNVPAPSSAVREVFAAPECVNPTATSSHFWIVARAVANFYEAHGVLPLPGALPDMKARSADYIALQNVYKSKSRADIAEVLAEVRRLEKELGCPTLADERDVESFCKNAAHIKLVRGRPFQIATDKAKIRWGDRAKVAAMSPSLSEGLLGLYIAFLAWDAFEAAQGRPPGAPSNLADNVEFATEADEAIAVSHAKQIVDDLLTEADYPMDEDERTKVDTKVAQYVGELVRAGGGELHNVAALTGGLIAQEVIKVITKQYIPVDNTCVFDGVTSRSEVFGV
ncbi:hypothetical protein BDY21DRAFT_318231 [Lineolata rhizophorae]|uniref:NEDD8-activating enzyme E1 regulatory subunit n=1 Tax=Lineolata rhizophorae TaxID=578093 RepID=A0A6A6P4X8_9PEZI|nr:hypothetical protein BDY21DRAFT_318231 [Lineolata rhizophorae]